MRDAQGNLHSDSQAKKAIVEDYYRNLYNASGADDLPEWILKEFDSKKTPTITLEVVKAALATMNKNKTCAVDLVVLKCLHFLTILN